MEVYIATISHNLLGIIALSELAQQLVVHTYTSIRIGSLRMDVQDIEETTVAHEIAHTYHRTIVGLGGVVLQEIERCTIAITHAINLGHLQ